LTYGQTDFKHILAFRIFRTTSHLKILSQSSASSRLVSAIAQLMYSKSLMFGSQYSSMLIPGHPISPEYKNKIVASGVGLFIQNVTKLQQKLCRVSVQPDAWASACQCITQRSYFHKAHPSGRAVSGMGQRPLACCDCRFESPVPICVCCECCACSQVDIFATGRSRFQRTVPHVACLNMIPKPQRLTYLGPRVLSGQKILAIILRRKTFITKGLH